MTGLLDLPPELINLIFDWLVPLYGWVDTSVDPFDPLGYCYCDSQWDPIHERWLYDIEASRFPEDYETDFLQFAMAHPYITWCIANGGWQGVVDAFLLVEREDLGVFPCVSKEIRDMVRYVLSGFSPSQMILNGKFCCLFHGRFTEGSTCRSPLASNIQCPPTSSLA
jgi:hypothetical protein